MNKYLMLSAVAAFAASAGGSAQAWTTQTAHFSGYCDGLEISHNGQIYADRHTYSGCGSGSMYAIGQGIAGTTKGVGKNVFLSDDSEPIVFGTNFVVSYDLSIPIKNGSHFAGWASFSGTTSFEYISGVMASGPAAKAKAGRPTNAKLAALIANRKGGQK